MLFSHLTSLFLLSFPVLQRPKSAYFFYLDDIRDQVKKEHPTKSMGEMSKVMGAMWNGIKETKEAYKYNKKAQEDKARYEKEKEEYAARD